MRNIFYSLKIKNWLKTANPSTSLLVGQFIFALIPNILIILLAYPSAKIITSLTVFDYSAAKLYLLFDFVLIALINISWFINNTFYSSQIKHIYKSAQEKIYNKLILMHDNSLKINSKEKLINIMTSSLFNLAEYSNIFIKQLASYISAIITLIVVFTLSDIIGLIILCLSIVVYFLFKIINNSISKNSFLLQSKRDETCEVFADIVNGRNEIFDLNQEPGLKNKYINSNLEIVELYKKQNNLNSLKYNWIKIFWKAIVALSTLYFISQVQYNFLSLSTYLILIPYLSECVDKFILAYDSYYNLELTHISALRIKTIFDIPEKDIIFFGNNITDDVVGSITFSNVSVSNSSKSSSHIKPFSYQIKRNQFCVFKGLKNCGKRHIFNLLKREEKPLTGTITIDSINIFDFDPNYYKKNLSYTTATPYFFDMSIMENLKLVNPNKNEILKTMKSFYLDSFINSLPKKYNTNIIRSTTEIPSYYLFLLGLARAKLTKSEILMIYEFPNGLTKKEIETIKSILSKLKSHKTIIVFSAMDIVDNIADKIIVVENGNVNV